MNRNHLRRNKNQQPPETLNAFEKHRLRVRNKQETLRALLTTSQQVHAEDALLSLRPDYMKPLFGVPEAFYQACNLDVSSARARNSFSIWFNLIGWSIVGRSHWAEWKTCWDAEEGSEVRFPGQVVRKYQKFYQTFSLMEQNILEDELRLWPTYENGNPFAGIRSRFPRLLSLDESTKESSLRSREICNVWFEAVGWYVVGRDTWIDTDGKVWGPPSYPYEGGDHAFPYSDALYDGDMDLWILPEGHPLKSLFTEALIANEAM